MKTPSEWIGNIPPDSYIHVYSGVTPEIADMVSRKLGQKLISVSFENNNMVVTDD